VVAEATHALKLDVAAAEGSDQMGTAAESLTPATLSPKRKTLRNRLRLRSRSSPSNSSASPSVRRADEEQPAEAADSPIGSPIVSNELTPKKSRSLIALVSRVARRNSKDSPSADTTAGAAASPQSSKQRGRKFSARLLNVGVNSAKVGIEFDKPYVKPLHRHASTSTSIDELLEAAAAAAAAESDGFAHDDAAAAAKHNSASEQRHYDPAAADNSNIASLHDVRVRLSTAALPSSPTKVRSPRANSRSRSPAASVKSITSAKSNASVKSITSVRSAASIRSSTSVRSSSSSKHVKLNAATAAATAAAVDAYQLDVLDEQQQPAAGYQRSTLNSTVASEARKASNSRSPSPSSQQQQQQHTQRSRSRSSSPRTAVAAANVDTNDVHAEADVTDHTPTAATAVGNGSINECDAVSDESSEFASVNDDDIDDDVISNSNSDNSSVHRDDKIHQHSIHYSKHSTSGDGGVLNSSAIRSISSSYIASPITSPQHIQKQQQQQKQQKQQKHHYQQQHDWVDAALSKGRLAGLNDEQMTALLAANTTSNSAAHTPTSVLRERNHSDTAQLLQHDADALYYSDGHHSDDDDVSSGSGFDSVYSNHYMNNSNSRGRFSGAHSGAHHLDSPIQLQQRSVLQLDTTAANASGHDSNSKHTTTNCWDRLHGEHEQRQQWLHDVALLQQQHARMQSTQGSKQRHPSKHQRTNSGIAASKKQHRSIQHDDIFDSGSSIDDHAELPWHVRLSAPKSSQGAANHYNSQAHDGKPLSSYYSTMVASSICSCSCNCV
jgi:hypothetical protein